VVRARFAMATPDSALLFSTPKNPHIVHLVKNQQLEEALSQ